VTLDEWVVMPNHLHGVIGLGDRIGVDGGEGWDDSDNDFFDDELSLDTCPKGTRSQSVNAIIQNFKSVSTRKINRVTGNAGRTVWQRDYYEHIIRHEKSLQRIREYIRKNPQSWKLDSLRPNHTKGTINPSHS
jgi:putative transposase